MCCISGSFDKSTLVELIKLGYDRAGHSYSITTIDDGIITSVKRALVQNSSSEILVDLDHTKELSGRYYLVHQQAPTTSARSLDSVHPSYQKKCHYDTYLWHNGIIKDDSIEYLREVYEMDGVNWDTALLHGAIQDMVYGDSQVLDTIKGGFACVYSNGQDKGLYLLRNSVCPLFVTDNLNISSIKLDESYMMLTADKVFYAPLSRHVLRKVNKFDSAEQPYFFL